MVEQNTPEWLEMRKNKIGASDAAVIMGVSPWKTQYQLWEEKLDLVATQVQNSAMKRGHDLEERARHELEKMTGLFLLPQVKFHASLPWMMASLDAIDPESKHIAEIKCPNKEDHQVALSGKVPEKYIPQLQHQLEVCELEMGYYFSFNGTEGALVKIFRDDKYIKQMIKKEKEFWECMQELIPPAMTSKDYEVKSGDLWDIAASQWISVNQQLKEVEKQEKQLRETLISMSQNKNAVGGGIRITKVLRKGAVEYAAIPEVQNINLDLYRKKPVQSYRIACM